MTSIFKQFYTHKRTELILQGKGVKVRKVLSVSITKPSGSFLNCVHVVYVVESGAKCSCFLSVKDYLQRSMNKRKEAAKEYRAERNLSGTWKVTGADSAYTVETTSKGIDCPCFDWHKQPELLEQHPYLASITKGFRICKHGFAALAVLKFDSLRDYLAAWKPGGRLNPNPVQAG